MPTIETFDIGNVVICDLCNEDYTFSQDTGGFLFGSKATCPKCAPRLEEDAKKYGEEYYIVSRCPPDKSFKDWVLELRGGDNKITITSYDPGEEIF